jgi:hypothetical protein
VAYYRLYFLDGSNRIEQFREFEAITDLVAIAQADEWRDRGAMELWSEKRKVRRWAALQPSAEAAAGVVMRRLRTAG